MEGHEHKEESLKKVSGLYKDWFLDYASYVILDRAIPSIFDGFKPVQRRIMAQEVMIVNAAVANLIREGKTAQIYSAIQTGSQYGKIGRAHV